MYMSTLTSSADLLGTGATTGTPGKPEAPQPTVDEIREAAAAGIVHQTFINCYMPLLVLATREFIQFYRHALALKKLQQQLVAAGVPADKLTVFTCEQSVLVGAVRAAVESGLIAPDDELIRGIDLTA